MFGFILRVERTYCCTQGAKGRSFFRSCWTECHKCQARGNIDSCVSATKGSEAWVWIFPCQIHSIEQFICFCIPTYTRLVVSTERRVVMETADTNNKGVALVYLAGIIPVIAPLFKKLTAFCRDHRLRMEQLSASLL